MPDVPALRIVQNITYSLINIPLKFINLFERHSNKMGDRDGPFTDSLLKCLQQLWLSQVEAGSQ